MLSKGSIVVVVTIVSSNGNGTCYTTILVLLYIVISVSYSITMRYKNPLILAGSMKLVPIIDISNKSRSGQL